MSTAIWPSSWKCLSFRSTTAHPSVTEGAVGSRPELDPERSAFGQSPGQLFLGGDPVDVEQQTLQLFGGVGHGSGRVALHRSP